MSELPPSDQGLGGSDRSSSLAPALPRRGRRDRQESALRELLRIVPFRRLWAAVAVSSLGDWLGLLAMTALAQQLTRGQSIAAQGAAISGVILTRLLPDLLFGAVAGAIADRLDRRMTVIIGEICAGTLYLAVALSYNLTFLYIAQFVIEAIGLFTMAAKQTLWVGSVPKDRLALANQLSLTSVYGMVPVASVLFAALSTISRFFNESGTAPSAADVRFAIVVALCVNTASFYFSATLVFLTRHELAAHADGGAEGERRGIWGLIREGVSFVKNNPVIRQLYVGILGAFAAGGFTVGVAQLYVNSLSAGTAGYSILFGTVFTGLALGMVVGPRIFSSISRRRIFGTAIAASGVFLLLMALVRDFVLADLLAALVGLCAGIAWIIGYTLIGQEVEDRLRGRTFAFVVSSVRIMLLLTVALGPLLAGFLSPSGDTGLHVINVGGVELVFSGPGLTLLIAGVLALLIGVYAGRSTAVRPLPMREALRRLVGRGQDLLGTDVRPGLFVVVESADRALASAQAEAMAESLRGDGVAVHLVRDPSDTGSGRRTRELLELAASGSLADSGLEPETLVLLALADRAELVAKSVRPALERGELVISDGYVDTTVAFFGGPDLADPERIQRISAWSTDDLRPDLTVVVDRGGQDADGPLAPARATFLSRAEDADTYVVVTAPPGLDDRAGTVLPAVLSAANGLLERRRHQLMAEPVREVPGVPTPAGGPALTQQ